MRTTNLKHLPCWHCKTLTRCGVEAVRVMCPDCTLKGHTFERPHVTQESAEEPRLLDAENAAQIGAAL